MRLTAAQKRLITAQVHAQDAWMCRAEWKIGCVPRNGHERRTIKSLIAKGAMEVCGQITNAGRDAWRNAARRSEKA